MGLKMVSWVRRYQGQCRALRPLGHQGYRLRNHTKDPPLCSGYNPVLVVFHQQNIFSIKNKQQDSYTSSNQQETHNKS